MERQELTRPVQLNPNQDPQLKIYLNDVDQGATVYVPTSGQKVAVSWLYMLVKRLRNHSDVGDL